MVALRIMSNPVDRAAAIYGSQRAMAKALGVTKAAVWQWKGEGRKVPIQYCLAIERDTNGSVSRRDLRPDDFRLIWPDLPVGNSEAVDSQRGAS